jgi:hypothetical protein
MKKPIRLFTLLLATVSITACAKHADEIPAQYISPLQYQSYECDQLATEMLIVSRRTSDLAAQVDKTASNDTAQMTVGLILLWPTLFFLDGDTPQAQEYARLKGEFDALEKVSIQKNCKIKVERPVIPDPEKEEVRTEKKRVVR